MLKKRKDDDTFWPSLTDLVLAMLLLVLILWIADTNGLKNRPDKPLVFSLEDVSGYTFASGSSSLSVNFGNLLDSVIVPKILAIVEEYPIEVMEVIGHTDGVPKANSSNMDTILTDFTFAPESSEKIARLRPGSNADLGLARALSVAAFLMNKFANSDNDRLQTLICRVYSAAQLISPSDNVVQGANKKDMPSRRRIELRFTRKSTPTLPVSAPLLEIVQ